MKIILFILFFFAQPIDTKNISGIVVDKYTNEPLAGVLIESGDNKTYSDLDGKFQIEYSDNIIVKYISYKTDTISYFFAEMTNVIELSQEQ